MGSTLPLLQYKIDVWRLDCIYRSNSLYGGGSADHLVHGGVRVEALGAVVLRRLHLGSIRRQLVSYSHMTDAMNEPLTRWGYVIGNIQS